jgi:nicotinamide riboside kinase
MIGGESTGKTTLARALAATSHGVVVSEALRTFVDNHGRTPLQEEQHSILLAQRGLEIAASHDHPSATILCDPATTMTAIYSELYFQDSTLRMQALEYAADYDALLWCRPDIPWVAEPGQHDGPQFREAADLLIARWLNDLRTATAVLEITGTQGRILMARDLLDEQFGSVWQQPAPRSST